MRIIIVWGKNEEALEKIFPRGTKLKNKGGEN